MEDRNETWLHSTGKQARRERQPMRRGRPTIFTPEIAATICERLAEGDSLRAVCREDGMPSDATVRMWALDDVQGFYSQYTRARDIAYRRMADEVLEIADNEGGDYARDRLRFDARRWLLSKALPKIYGDKLAHVGGDEEDQPIRHMFTWQTPQ